MLFKSSFVQSNVRVFDTVERRALAEYSFSFAWHLFGLPLAYHEFSLRMLLHLHELLLFAQEIDSVVHNDRVTFSLKGVLVILVQLDHLNFGLVRLSNLFLFDHLVELVLVMWLSELYF